MPYKMNARVWPHFYHRLVYNFVQRIYFCNMKQDELTSPTHTFMQYLL